MKKFKKLIPALCMLLISAVLMGTSTYAWFSMNKTVSATGMEVTAKSNSTYLLIGTKNETYADIQAKTAPANTSVEALKTAGNAGGIYPCAYADTAIAKTDAEGNWVEAGSWYTANSSSSSNATANVTNYNTINLGQENYMYTYEMNLTLSADSMAYNGKVTVALKMTAAGNKQDNSAVRAYVVIGNKDGQFVDQTTTSVDFTEVALTNDTVVAVKVYVFIDGTKEAVFSDNVTKNGIALTGKLDISFTID